MRQLVALLLFFFTTLTFAADDSYLSVSEFTQAVNLAGITYTQSNNDVDVVIELNKALAAIPAMQRSGIVNPKLSEADIKLLPVSLSVSLVGMFYTAGILQHIYTENKVINDLHIIGYVLAPNEFGIIDKQPCYSFDFNRELFDKIKWENFVAPNLIAISMNFNFTPWCKAVMHQETANRLN